MILFGADPPELIHTPEPCEADEIPAVIVHPEKIERPAKGELFKEDTGEK